MFNLVIWFMLAKWPRSRTHNYSTVYLYFAFLNYNLFTTNQWIIEGVPKFNSSNRNTHTFKLVCTCDATYCLFCTDINRTGVSLLTVMASTNRHHRQVRLALMICQVQFKFTWHICFLCDKIKSAWCTTWWTERLIDRPILTWCFGSDWNMSVPGLY